MKAAFMPSSLGVGADPSGHHIGVHRQRVSTDRAAEPQVIFHRPPIRQHRVGRTPDVRRELQPTPGMLMPSYQGKLAPVDQRHDRQPYEDQNSK
jgi:hypothetical protein